MPTILELLDAVVKARAELKRIRCAATIRDMVAAEMIFNSAVDKENEIKLIFPV